MTTRPRITLLLLALLVPAIAVGGVDGLLSLALDRPPRFVVDPGVALIDFAVLASPFLWFWARAGEVDFKAKPHRARGLVIASAVGGVVMIGLYIYLLITTTPMHTGEAYQTGITLGAAMLLLGIPIIAVGVIRIVWSMVSGGMKEKS